MITDATFWLQPPEAREEQIPSLDPHCLVCGQSLENQAFFWELYMGPQLDIAGMHLRCAYLHSVRVLSDLAANAPGAARAARAEQSSDDVDDVDDVDDADADEAIFETAEDEPPRVHVSYPPDTSDE